MSDSNRYEIRAPAPNHPDAKHVDAHLVVERQEWIPGEHPNPDRGHDGQTEYLERYLHCLRCEIEVIDERDLPVECDGETQ